MVLAPLGRFEEALDQLRQALALAPEDHTILNVLASVCVKAGRHAEAEQYVNTSLALADRSPAAHMAQGMNLASQGRHAEAVAPFERALHIRRSAWTQAHLAYSLAKAGRAGEAQRYLAELLRALNGTNPPLFECAVAALAAGQRKEAMALLERAAEALSESVLWVKVDYRFAELRGEPEFEKLLRRLNL
jgi:Flp pilus assembly protein TadD